MLLLDAQKLFPSFGFFPWDIALGAREQYILQGYAVNERLLAAQGKTIELQSRIIAGAFEGEETEVLKAVNAYTDALTLLDNYDHQTLSKPEGTDPVYRITYEECRNMIDHMEYAGKSAVFGVEKEKGKVSGILDAVFPECVRTGSVSFSGRESCESSLLHDQGSSVCGWL